MPSKKPQWCQIRNTVFGWTRTRFPFGTSSATRLFRSEVFQDPCVSAQKCSRYEVRPRSDKRGVNLISDALPFGRLWYGAPNAISNAIAYAKFTRRL